MNKLRKEADKFLSVPCAGYEINTISEYDVDCGYNTDIICEECVCNFSKNPTSLVFDPVTNKPIPKKVVKYMRKILKEEIQ